MSKQLQRTTEPAAASPETMADLLAEINALSPTPLGEDDVYVRSMILCTDRVCESDWCRFSPTALAEIAEKIAGVSVLAGHDRRSLPVGRFFRGRVVELPEENPATGRPVVAVRAWFYWLAATSGAEDLLRNIDGGIYRAVSVSWRYEKDHCSVCGAATGCGHTPGRTYGGQLCHRVIDHVDEVLEGSLVYKGADSAAQVGRQRDAHSSRRVGGGFSWDRAWIAFMARALADLPLESCTFRAAGVLARETEAILHNLGWRFLARTCPASPRLVWYTAAEGETVDFARLAAELAGPGRLIVAGPGGRAPLAALPRGLRLSRLLALPFWNRPWWVLELEKEAVA
ncbi:hypothetical protein HS125_17025 [bacterium]|nr:hypothetical protein [bacterium]